MSIDTDAQGRPAAARLALGAGHLHVRAHRMRSYLASIVLFLSAAVGAQPVAPGDPAIGGYFFFAALDRKCPAGDPARAAAVERFKQHFIAGMRPLAVSYGAAGAKALEMLDDLERNGPPDSELAGYDELFSRASADELLRFCRETPKLIEERIALENRMRGAVPSNQPRARR